MSQQNAIILKKKKNRKSELSGIPGGPMALRETVLNEAGVNAKELGRLARKGIEKAEKLLDATDKFPIIKRGEVVEVLDIPANAVQLKAAQHLTELAGVMPSRANGVNNVTPVVQINISTPWAKVEADQEVREANAT